MRSARCARSNALENAMESYLHSWDGHGERPLRFVSRSA